MTNHGTAWRAILIGLGCSVALVLLLTVAGVTYCRAPSSAYIEARESADLPEEDLLACWPFSGAREFSMVGDRTGPEGRLSFIATTLVGTTPETTRMTYYVQQDWRVQGAPLYRLKRGFGNE